MPIWLLSLSMRALTALLGMLACRPRSARRVTTRIADLETIVTRIPSIMAPGIFTTIMIISRILLAVAMLMLAWACKASDEHGLSNAATPRLPEHQGLADLPHLAGPAIRSPYVRYSETTNQSASRGLVFYLYPLVRRRNELLVVEHQPGTAVSADFGGDIVGGMSGLVVNSDHQTRVEFLPISLPARPTANQRWRLRYADRDFVCISRVGPDAVIGQIVVSCAGQG